MPKSQGIIAQLRRRPEHERRIAGITLYAIAATAAMFLWARSFPDLMAIPAEPSGEANASGRPSLLSPFASVGKEFGRAASGFTDLMRAIPHILGKTEELASRPVPPESEFGNAVSEDGNDSATIATPPATPPTNVIVPPEATGMAMPTRIARVEQNGIAAEIVLDAADSPASLRIPALAPSAQTAAMLAAASESSFLDPIRNILLSFTRNR